MGGLQDCAEELTKALVGVNAARKALRDNPKGFIRGEPNDQVDFPTVSSLLIDKMGSTVLTVISNIV
jgi:hypothetical protein